MLAVATASKEAVPERSSHLVQKCNDETVYLLLYLFSITNIKLVFYYE